MNHEVDWTYLYPSFGLLMRAFDIEAKRYEEGFAITPNRVTITYKDALNAYKFFVLNAINDSLPDEIIHYDLPISPFKIEQRIGRLDRIGR